MLSTNHLILCCLLLLWPSVFPSIIIFSSESTLRIMWPNYWRFSFSLSLFNEYSGLISFRIELTGLISLLSKGLSRVFSNSLKASFLRRSPLFMVQLSHLYMTTGKTIALNYMDLCQQNDVSAF